MPRLKALILIVVGLTSIFAIDAGFSAVRRKRRDGQTGEMVMSGPLFGMQSKWTLLLQSKL